MLINVDTPEEEETGTDVELVFVDAWFVVSVTGAVDNGTWLAVELRLCIFAVDDLSDLDTISGSVIK